MEMHVILTPEQASVTEARVLGRLVDRLTALHRGKPGIRFRITSDIGVQLTSTASWPTDTGAVVLRARTFAEGYLEAVLDWGGYAACPSDGSVTVAEFTTMDPAGQITVINAALERIKQRLERRSAVDENIAMLDAALAAAKNRDNSAP